MAGYIVVGLLIIYLLIMAKEMLTLPKGFIEKLKEKKEPKP